MRSRPARPGTQKVSDEALLAAYAELGSVHKVGERVGLNASSVHERLQTLGAAKPMNVFTDAERERLQREYVLYRAHGKVSELAADMGRTVQFLSRQARALGLTTYRYERVYSGKWKYLSDDAARVLMDDFKASPLGLMQYCAKYGYDDEGFRRTLQTRWPDEWEHVIESKVLVTSKYRLGRQVEYRVRDLLRADGYVVLRSPASRSAIDLAAIKPARVLFIQCKRSGALPPAGWNALFDMAEGAGAIPVMAENPYPRCMRYWRLIDRKGGSRRRQPMEPFDPFDGTLS